MGAREGIAGEGCSGATTPSAALAERRFTRWALAATAVYLLAAMTLRWRARLAVPLPWLAVGASLVFWAQTVRVYLLYLRRADELERKIQLDALAIGFGSGAIFALLAPLLTKLGLPLDGESGTALVMMFGWAFGILSGRRRYAGRDSA